MGMVSECEAKRVASAHTMKSVIPWCVAHGENDSIDGF